MAQKVADLQAERDADNQREDVTESGAQKRVLHMALMNAEERCNSFPQTDYFLEDLEDESKKNVEARIRREAFKGPGITESGRSYLVADPTTANPVAPTNIQCKSKGQDLRPRVSCTGDSCQTDGVNNYSHAIGGNDFTLASCESLCYADNKCEWFVYQPESICEGEKCETKVDLLEKRERERERKVDTQIDL